jgi:hypothetical protein
MPKPEDQSPFKEIVGDINYIMPKPEDQSTLKEIVGDINWSTPVDQSPIKNPNFKKHKGLYTIFKKPKKLYANLKKRFTRKN